MKILFIHQNFPGQFKFLAPALVGRGHSVTAMMMQTPQTEEWQGIKLIPYQAARSTSTVIHPWVVDFETKVIRAEACFRKALELKKEGYTPDVIIAHPGWGESLFLKDLWTQAKLGIYCEFYYPLQGADVGFDPEFPVLDEADVGRMRIKNINNILHLETADAGLAPTLWQGSTYPQEFHKKMTVTHDGINTELLTPDPNADVTITAKDNSPFKLTKKDQVITFVSRNLEPYRGYHIFMRALPLILKKNPKAYVLIIGGDGVSYGLPPDPQKYGHTKWREIFANEIRPQLTDEEWKRIFFTGSIPYETYVAALQISSAHVYLTYPFVLSWSLLEAMSIGCPIVSSATQPVQEVIEHNKSGLLVDFFDVADLAESVTKLLNSKADRERLGSKARDFVVKNFDLKSVCLPTQIAWVEGLAAPKKASSPSKVNKGRTSK